LSSIELYRFNCINDHAKIGYVHTPGNPVQPNSRGRKTKFELITQAEAMTYVTIKSEQHCNAGRKTNVEQTLEAYS
jgi:hypothetical protein